MFNVRKSLVIAITVVMMLAMVVPAAMAAPEWAMAVEITEPTNAEPVYVQTGEVFTVKADIWLVGLQVNDLDVRFRVFRDGGISGAITEIQWAVDGMAPEYTYTGTFSFTPFADDGSWDIQVCVRDRNSTDQDGEWICDIEPGALVLDNEDPGVRLLKPAPMAILNGSELLVGKAWDPWFAEDSNTVLRYGGIAKVWFDYCSDSNWLTQFGSCGEPSDVYPWGKSWITVASSDPDEAAEQGVGFVEPSGIPDEYKAMWDTTLVSDGFGRICVNAMDHVGNIVFDCDPVSIQNRFTIQLHPGWNLISTPLMLYEPCLEDALGHLWKQDYTNNTHVPTWAAIYSVENLNADEPDEYKWSWKKAPDTCTEDWPELSAAPGTLSCLEAGKGYWLYMKSNDELTFVGTWKNVGPSVPQEYQVFEGWNLIGYTHWGLPPVFPFQTQTVSQYLGGQVLGLMESMYRYDAQLQGYIELTDGSHMVDGAGYWLALSDMGTINP